MPLRGGGVDACAPNFETAAAKAHNCIRRTAAAAVDGAESVRPNSIGCVSKSHKYEMSNINEFKVQMLLKF